VTGFGIRGAVDNFNSLSGVHEYSMAAAINMRMILFDIFRDFKNP
jgi:hypothetical protein